MASGAPSLRVSKSKRRVTLLIGDREVYSTRIAVEDADIELLWEFCPLGTPVRIEP